MEKYLKEIFDLTKLPTKLFFLLSLVSGFILFEDQGLLNEKLFLDNIKDKYGWILGIVFTLSTGLVIVNSIIWIYKSIRQKILIRKWKKKLASRVKSLDRFERSVLREFVTKGQSSLEMSIDDPTVSGLLHKKILIMNRQYDNVSLMRGTRASLSIDENVLKIIEYKDLGLSDSSNEKRN